MAENNAVVGSITPTPIRLWQRSCSPSSRCRSAMASCFRLPYLIERLLGAAVVAGQVSRHMGLMCEGRLLDDGGTARR